MYISHEHLEGGGKVLGDIDRGGASRKFENLTIVRGETEVIKYHTYVTRFENLAIVRGETEVIKYHTYVTSL